MAKDASLELLRGVAALVVLNGHCLGAFAPLMEGEGDLAGQSLKTSLAFVAFNGGSAVYLFFVLSSYVLVKRYFQTSKAQDLRLGAIKRLPRLAGPVLVTTLASCIIFKLDLYFIKDAAAVTQSDWLRSFGNASKVLSPETASFADAFLQGAWRTFIYGDNYYDSSLWTMTVEFWGSMLTFALAPIVFFLQGRWTLSFWVCIAAVVFLALQVSYFLCAFPASLLLYPLLAMDFRPNRWVRGAMVMVSLALLGYAGSAVGIYRPFAVLDVASDVGLRQACVAIPASVMLVYAVLSVDEPLSWLSGKVARFLGDLSFPLYLVHVPVICSLGSWVLLTSGSTALGAAAAILGSILAALPLMTFNNWWVQMVGALFNRFRRGGPIAAAPAASSA
ncbi:MULTISPECIES: acyltransferase [Mesorhizobium]|uniref:Acyltransferase 3 n=2 Tax=Mesorhizobium TaxID=68287 RepID=E8TFC1_MESCW|nr:MULTISPECIES: acyltransferase [Mesorhizobium]RUZ69669.1 acyltransferase [Mesorhizobium sp. M7A.F.Ca.US.003.02.2.1]ADV13461.1 acyltransferase 3 [Mesorhizobium ciceri biovar biserrulae WSM1271]MBZ9718056.1 acyltransferase [Mesorhizobium sp. AD1-1]RUZ26553.1 acyltransferase [Mesorhizobium sp. M7A.F.Ca.US.007.01.2.1]RUZ41409.1 acyltransferase [Mesorhizobium sp. M7A.F.Ca.US.003.02.1.1]